MAKTISFPGEAHVKSLLLAASSLALVLAPAAADARKRLPPLPAQAALPLVLPSDPVEAYYVTHGNAPIWLRSPDSRAAAAQLPMLLRRAQVEGLSDGPQLAAQVEQALAAAASGNPQAVQAAEYAASKAWVRYVQMLKTPPQGIVYGYPAMAPQGSRADQIVLTAAANPNLPLHLVKTADLNPTYVALRNAAWSAFQSTASIDTRLLANLQRARVLPAGGRYILVNAATARLTMFENGRPVDSMKVVVGKPELPTPMIVSQVFYATLNPYWNVPDHLIRGVVAPRYLKQGIGYLKMQGYEVMADWSDNSAVIPNSEVDWKALAAGTAHVRIRQRPGPANSMGKMKFNFRNSEDIYLHDSPEKELFLKPVRALSNGCIRLEDARRLGRWLLGADPVTSDKAPEQHVKLPEGVPVYVTYLTAAPDPSTGQIVIANDVYGRDAPSVRTAAAQ